jgi:hypothetical protein
MQRLADGAARKRREDAEALDREWVDPTRQFNGDESAAELTALASRRNAGVLTDAQHDNLVASVKVRTTYTVPIASRIAAELRAVQDPINSLTPGQVDRLWRSR